MDDAYVTRLNTLKRFGLPPDHLEPGVSETCELQMTMADGPYWQRDSLYLRGDFHDLVQSHLKRFIEGYTFTGKHVANPETASKCASQFQELAVEVAQIEEEDDLIGVFSMDPESVAHAQILRNFAKAPQKWRDIVAAQMTELLAWFEQAAVSGKGFCIIGQ